MGKETVFPVRALREQVTSLEAAVTLVLAEAKPKHVHKLRTSVRRIEAQMELLSLVDGVPEHAPVAKKVRRRLRKLRRAAGAVRDCDVQMDLVKGQDPDGAGGKFHREIRKLARQLKKNREKEKDDLLAVVRRQREKLVPQVERLMEVLEPAEELGLGAAEMTALIRRWIGGRLQAVGAEERGEERLHGMRKTAKLARYIAETAPDGWSDLRRMGRSYEALQQSGGTWHDWLTLWRMARRHLGEGSPLAEHFERERDLSLGRYEEALAIRADGGLTG